MSKNACSTPSTVVEPWHQEIKSPFKVITPGFNISIRFLGKTWHVTADEMVCTGWNRMNRTEELLYTLTAPDGEIRRMTSSAYLDLVRENEEDDV